ncbi:HNH endonuclease [Rapidithrix thailandica]|uniref:HNH endonuclease n=1 Tax=Rapidithrix thailandica TaxID=413964 RepID=A0AAW9S7Q1_9BACT
MADIETPISFSSETLEFIKSIDIDNDFSHEDWGNDEYMSIRKEARNFYRIEQKGNCAYCRGPVSMKSASNCQVEHIVPKSLHKEFAFTPKNLCVVCADCNEIKREQETIGDIKETLKTPRKVKKYPRSSGAFLIVHPHFDNYADHILIVNGLYVDKSSKKGNFTIGTCNLNRRLAEFGWESDILDDSELMNEMNSYITETSQVKRTKSLNKIKAQLFNI